MKKILLLSAYRSDSHASWATWLEKNIEADWRILELPGRYFRWRIRGNPLSWRQALTELLSRWQPDRILATSMVDIATLRGLHPELATIPLSYYFHENQFAYPLGEGQHSSIDPMMVQLYGALAADECLFNSAYNRDSFVSGVEALLRKLPDEKPEGLSAELIDKSVVLPVPVPSVSSGQRMPGLILWNHRWEYDKRPDRFLKVLERLHARSVPFSLALLGPRPQKVPAALTSIRQQFGSSVIADGMVSRQQYQQLLGQAQVVISCADHEFQGLSMIEAVSAGCVPVVPDDLCYREQYAADYRYAPDDTDAAVTRIEQALSGALTAPDITAWTDATTSDRWQQWYIQG